jgi:hypothetical protein
MQGQTTRTPSVVWETDEPYVRVERDADRVVILAPLEATMTASKTIERAEPLLSTAEREAFREAFGL